MKKPLILVLVLTVGIAMGAVGSRVLAQQPEQIGALTRTTLLHTGATGVQTSGGNPFEIYVFDVTIAAGGTAPRHFHPGNETFVVTQGTGVFQEDGKPPVALKPGVTVHIDPKNVHMAKADGSGPLKLIDFGVYEAGQPPTTAVQ
jgi:quercetin dioxygenase-like cupin family protein